MVSKCANPACGVPFIYLRNGKLWALERFSESIEKQKVEFFWLCGECARHMTIEATSSGINVVPSVPTEKNTSVQFVRLSWRSSRAFPDVAPERTKLIDNAVTKGSCEPPLCLSQLEDGSQAEEAHDPVAWSLRGIQRRHNPGSSISAA